MSAKLLAEISEVRYAVDYSDNRSAFIDHSTNKALRGVSKACHKHYYPNFKLSRRVATASDKTNKRKYVKKELCKHAHIVGSLRGSIVDSEIRKVVKIGKRTCGLERMHPYTRKLVKAIEMLNFKLVATQVPVFDLDRGIATAIDLICEKKGSRTLYLIEIKCGYNDNTFTDHNSQMKHELKSVSNSPKHQHQVQAAVAHFLFLNTYKSKQQFSSVETLIARVTDYGTHFEPIRPWIKPWVAAIIERIRKD